MTPLEIFPITITIRLRLQFHGLQTLALHTKIYVGMENVSLFLKPEKIEMLSLENGLGLLKSTKAIL